MAYISKFKTLTLTGVISLAALVAASTPLSAQTITTGDILGVISDSSGAVVPNAKVTLKSLENGETRTESSNGQGQYRFSLLKPGDYDLSAESAGLKSNRDKVSLLVGQAVEVNIKMNPQGTSTVMEVTTETAILQTENANIESNFNRTQIDALPMPGGDLTTLAMTSPGIRVNVTGGSGNMNANGIPGSTVLFTLDGMDQMDPYNNLNNSGASNNLLGANSVGEVAVVTNAYSPQYGRMAGAQVNMVGLTGTNQFHGNLFYNYNYQGLNANSFFANSSGTPKGRADAHQFGGRIGGPVIKNKLFLFFSDENLRYVLPGSGFVSLPSPQLQAYALAHVSAAQLPLYQDYFALVNGAPGLNRAVAVTNGTGVLQDGNNHLGCGIDSFTGTPAPGGGIFGQTVSCAIALGTNANQLNTELNYTIRGDYNINANQKMFFRFNRDQGVQATGVSPINPLYNSISVQPSNQWEVNHSWVMTPAMVNSFSLSALNYVAQFGVQNFSKTVALMPDSIAISDGGANGGGFATIGAGAYPNGRNVARYQLNDDWSWTRGKHTFKAGINARYDQISYTSITSGAFLGAYSISDLGDFANGVLNYAGKGYGSSFSQSFPLYAALHFRVPASDFYVADEWAVSPNIKVSYGMRFEVDNNPGCVENCFILTNTPFTASGYQGGINTPYNATLLKGNHLFYNSEPIIVQPRVGVAYKPFGTGKTVVRAGVGLFSTNYTDSLGGTLANQVPNKFAPSGLNFGSVGLITDPTSSAYTAQASANAFFSGFNSGYTLAQVQNAVKPATFSLPSIASFPSTFRAAKDIEWSFEIQQEIDSHDSITASYVGNHGYNLQESVNANMYANSNSTKYYGFNYGGLPGTPADARFQNVTQYYNNGVSNYNSLTVQYRHTFAYGITGQIHYTWSHALGTIGYENPYNLSNSYGSLGFDNRHQVGADALWTQPYKASNPIVNQIIKGWSVGLKTYVYTGAPFSVTDSKIASDTNSTGGVLTPLADLLVPSAFNTTCNASNSIGVPCIPKTDFATYSTNPTTPAIAGQPIQTDWGNIAPNSFRGPGYFDMDITVLRAFTVRERWKLNLGMQAYNILNHPNFANPSGSVTSGSFGEITGTLGPPTSIYGSFQGASVSGRVIVLTGTFNF